MEIFHRRFDRNANTAFGVGVGRVTNLGPIYLMATDPDIFRRRWDLTPVGNTFTGLQSGAAAPFIEDFL